MNLEQAKQAWRDEPGPTEEEILRRAEGARGRAKEFERTIHNRDWRESGAAILVIGLFVPALFGAPTWLAKSGALVIIAHAAGIVMVLQVSQRCRPELPADASLVDHLKGKLDDVRRQARLIGAAPWWYVAPSLVGQLLFVAGITKSLVDALPFAAICIVFCAFIAWLNVRASRVWFTPFRIELERAIADLEGAV